jgi:hypothetical protein
MMQYDYDKEKSGFMNTLCAIAFGLGEAVICGIIAVITGE